MVLRDALQPVVPWLATWLSEQVVDDEQFEVDAPLEFLTQMLRPVVRPLDMDAVEIGAGDHHPAQLTPRFLGKRLREFTGFECHRDSEPPQRQREIGRCPRKRAPDPKIISEVEGGAMRSCRTRSTVGGLSDLDRVPSIVLVLVGQYLRGPFARKVAGVLVVVRGSAFGDLAVVIDERARTTHDLEAPL